MMTLIRDGASRLPEILAIVRCHGYDCRTAEEELSALLANGELIIDRSHHFVIGDGKVTEIFG